MAGLAVKKPQQDSCARRKPDGGYCLIPVRQLLAAWWAFREKRIELRDFRVWCAAWEVKAKRCLLDPKRAPRFGLHELHSMIGGVGGEHLRRSLRRLSTASLLAFSERSIEHRDGEPSGAFEDWVSQIQNTRRRLPMPRRTLRLLAAESRPATVATVLGHLLRCVYYRSGGIEPAGLCKASWIAEVFGVDERSVKRARGELATRGWLRTEAVPQTVMNRFGIKVTVSLAWEGGRRRLSPRAARSTTRLSPPRRTGNSVFDRSENQKPGGPGPDGVRTRTRGRSGFIRVTHRDLTSALRLRDLYSASVAAGYVRRCRADELAFFAAASHARRVGTRNPPGLFATMLRKRLWHHIAVQDEKAGLQLLERVPRDSQPIRQQFSVGIDEQLSAEAVRLRILESLAEGESTTPTAREDSQAADDHR